MGPWLDFLMLALALGTGWITWVMLTASGLRPLALPPRRVGSPASGGPRRRPVTNSQAIDGDR
jgi:hypothetical protein